MSILMELLAQHENVELEMKSAQGRDKRGDVPQDAWKTYVAMANTYGGTILLGIKEETDHRYTVLGLGNPHRVQKLLWDQLNNGQVVNVNILQDRDIECIDHEGKSLIVIHVRQAKREERPVYIGKTP